jgi:hypothetical protein
MIQTEGSRMIVYLEPPGGRPRDYLERAKVEMERVLGFCGTVTQALRPQGSA